MSKNNESKLNKIFKASKKKKREIGEIEWLMRQSKALNFSVLN